MKSLIKLFFHLLFILTLYHCSIIPTTIEKNTLEIISLTTNETQLLLRNPDNSQKMFIDIILSHPSKYKLTFNQYDDEEENEILNGNLFFYYNKNIINSLLRGLSSDYTQNQTSLIENDTKILGTNKITLDLSPEVNDTIKNVLLYIKKNEEEEEKNDDDDPNEDDEKIMIRYTFINYDEKYSLNNTKIKNEQNKDNLDIKFSGISFASNIMDNLSDVTAVYSINFFDKETLESKYENIYISSFIKEEALLSKEYEFKNDNISDNKNINLKALLNNKKEQLLLITVKLMNSDNIECYFQYEFMSFKVVEISRDNELPDNEKKEEEIDYDNNRKENLTVFIVILSCFSGMIIITFIGVFIYFSISNNFGKSDNDMGYDFKNIGQIKTLKEDDN